MRHVRSAIRNTLAHDARSPVQTPRHTQTSVPPTARLNPSGPAEATANLPEFCCGTRVIHHHNGIRPISVATRLYPCNRLQSFSRVFTNALHSWSVRSENATCSLYSVQRGESSVMTLSESSITVANSSNRCRELGNGVRQSRSHSHRLSVRASCQAVAYTLHLVRGGHSERAARLCYGRGP